MDTTTKERLFKSFDSMFRDFEVYSVAERFRLINEYQSSRLDAIEKVNNATQRMALGRTSMYELDRVLKECMKKTDNNKSLFRLVNLFCISVTEYHQLDGASGLEKNAFNYIMDNKTILRNNIEWYLRVIPESEWLIDIIKSEEY